MTIKSGNPASALILVTDTVLLNPTEGRVMVTFASLHEQTGSGETVELFESADAVSAAGERIETISLSAGETVLPESLAGFSLTSGRYLIAKAATGSQVFATLTFTQYDGAS